MYRHPANGGDRPKSATMNLRAKCCLACGATDDLQLAHVKPRDLGGTYAHAITLCRTHHAQYDRLLRAFWEDAFLLRAS